MADVKDVLGVARTPAVPSAEKKKAPKEPVKKPEGIHREVLALTGGVPPIVPAVDVRKRAPTQKVSWQWLPILSSARTDDLKIYHWLCIRTLLDLPLSCCWQTRLVDSHQSTSDYPFAKYNRKIELIEYADHEYAECGLDSDPSWTREETDHLLDLCRRFDLRFTIIADRWEFRERSVEDLKDRYYWVARKVLDSRASIKPELLEHAVFREPYNSQQERERKQALQVLWTRTRQQEREDAEVLAEAKAIQDARRAQAEASGATVVEEGDEAGAAPDKAAATKCGAGVYLRGARLAQNITQSAQIAGSRVAKRMEQTLEELGVPKIKTPTEQVCKEYLTLRSEIMAMLELQKQVLRKESELAALRDNPAAEVPATPATPKGSVFAERRDRFGRFIGAAAGDGAVPVKKTDHKRKAPPKAVEPVAASPQNMKRARKARVPDD
eukprot:jgi/Chlat1/4610/Chrsp290S04353